MKLLKIFFKILKCVLKVLLKGVLVLFAGFFVSTFTIYMFNLDGKLIDKKYDEMKEHFDNMERDTMI